MGWGGRLGGSFALPVVFRRGRGFGFRVEEGFKLADFGVEEGFKLAEAGLDVAGVAGVAHDGVEGLESVAGDAQHGGIIGWNGA